MFSSHEATALRRRQVRTIGPHRDQAGLDVEVAAKLLPADLDVGTHDEIRSLGRQPGEKAPLPPAPLEGETTQHAGLARAGRRAPGRARAFGVPEAGEDVHAPPLDLRGLRVLVLVDHVLRRAFRHQQFGFRLHPRRHERREIEAGIAVQHQLVVDDLERDPGRHALVGKAKARHRADLAMLSELRPEAQLVVVGIGRVRVQWHDGLLVAADSWGDAVSRSAVAVRAMPAPRGEPPGLLPREPSRPARAIAVAARRVSRITEHGPYRRGDSRRVRQPERSAPSPLVRRCDHHACPRVRHAAPIGVLVGEERHDHKRQAGGQGPECGPRATMADDKAGFPKDHVLRHPSFDMDVVGDRAQLRHVHPVADCEQHSYRDALHRLQRDPVQLRCARQGPGDAAQAQIGEGERFAPPELRQVGDVGTRRFAVTAGVGVRVRVERGGKAGQVRRAPDLFHDPAFVVLEHRRCGLERPGFVFTLRDGDLSLRDAPASGDDGCRVLAGLPERELRTPVGEGRLHRGQHRGGAQACEQFPLREQGRRRPWQGRDGFAHVSYLVCRWLCTDPYLAATILASGPHRGRDDGEHLVAAVAKRVDDGAERVQVARAPERTGDNDSHDRDAKPWEGGVVQSGGSNTLCIWREAIS